MKYVITLFLISFSSVVFSQITLNDMIKLCNTDLDQFENFALTKGFDYDNLKSNSDIDITEKILIYSKGDGLDKKYLTLYIGNYPISVTYQTPIHNEFLILKNQLKNQGFKFISSKTEKDSDNVETFRKYYTNKKWTFIVSNYNDGTLISIKKYNRYRDVSQINGSFK